MRTNIPHMYHATELCMISFLCIVLALYGVLCWVYCLTNTYNCSGHCDYVCGTGHSTVVPRACIVTSSVCVSWCPAFMYCSMFVSQCHTHCLVVLSIGLFAIVFYLPAFPMYRNILYKCTTALPMYCSVPYRCTAASACIYHTFIQPKRRLSYISSH